MAAGRTGRTELILGLAAGMAALGFAFRGRRPGFWVRMALGTGALGLFTVARRRPVLSPPGPAEIASGLASAALLYALFQVGDRLSRRFLPQGEAEIRAIYRLRQESPRPIIAALLATVIAPAEELFWRGFVVDTLARQYSPATAALLGAAFYAGAHMVTGNLTLIGAAGVAGLFWGGQYLIQRRLEPLIISHIVWDLWVFLIAPTPAGREE
jgi:membrane protease YdiL (CAAX protease family)